MPPSREVILVGGHESRGGRSLTEDGGPLALVDPALAGPTLVTAAGRELDAALRDRGRAVVVPITLGRDPDLLVAAAQTLAWAARDRLPGDLLLTRPLGTVEHLVGWVRAAILRGPGQASATRAALLVAPAATAEQDAELFKVARLVWHNSPIRLVEVALLGGAPDVAEGVERCRRLGARDVRLVPASFVPPPTCEDAQFSGPLLGRAALTALIADRVASAEHRWARHADDGLSDAIEEHGHSHDHEHQHA